MNNREKIMNTQRTLHMKRAQPICAMPEHRQESAAVACCRPTSPTFMGTSPLLDTKTGFWRSTTTWWRASKNTLNCLIGCSIGDFGMLLFLQVYYPETPIMLRMILAMITGLITSVIFEAIILKTKEGFQWPEAFKVAFSMSIISMLGMEIAANATDYFLTDGTTSPATAWYWGALGISLVVGFLAPLPYNYYKLEKHGKACH
jgi:hypothetical protein